MNLSVPYFSQHKDVTDAYWQKRACGMACVKMALDFLKKDAPSLDDLIWQGVRIDGYGPSGWLHGALVSIFDMHGIRAERKEFKADGDGLSETGISEIVRSLEEGMPVIVSAVKKFEETDKFHMVLLIGFEKENGAITGFRYHDPDAEAAEEGANLFVPFDQFKKHWRRLAIFPHKK
jgi:hypothetical protein